MNAGSLRGSSAVGARRPGHGAEGDARTATRSCRSTSAPSTREPRLAPSLRPTPEEGAL